MYVDIDISFMWGSVTSQKRSNEFNSRSLTMHICLSSSVFKILLLVRGLSGLLTVLLTILARRYPSLCFPRLVPRWRLVSNLATSSNACTKDRRWCSVLSMVVSICVGIGKQSSCFHTRLFSCRKSKHLTPKVITGHYVITLCSAFGQTIKVGYSPSLLLLWTLDRIHGKFQELLFLPQNFYPWFLSKWALV